MDSAIIYFSDQSFLKLTDGDYLIPIVYHKHEDGMFASASRSIKLEVHTHDGLIPSIMEAFANCNFFYLNHDNSVVYSVNSIVKIEIL